MVIGNEQTRRPKASRAARSPDAQTTLPSRSSEIRPAARRVPVEAMCRLFGLAAGSEPVKATFWLLEAPDSLANQSRRNPDGYGLATFDVNGQADVQIEKRPVAAYEDEQFAREANERQSATR